MGRACDRYYQITNCFRDGDLRADRQPDSPRSTSRRPSGEGDPGAEWRDMIRNSLQTLSRSCCRPFPVITYHERLAGHGSDKADLRVLLQLTV